MASRVRISGGDVTLAALLPEFFDERARSAAFATFAREQIGYADEVNRAVLGRVPARDTFVDGRKDARLESVRADGQIIAEYHLLEEVLVYIQEQLRKHSPIGKSGDPRPGHPGMYRDSHVLVVDGKAWEPGAAMPVEFDDAFFASTVPYARRIERGWSSQAPDGVYEAVALLAQRRFGNIARVGFSWRSLLVGGVADWAGSASARRMAESRRGGNRATHQDWLTRQPAVTVRPR